MNHAVRELSQLRVTNDERIRPKRSQGQVLSYEGVRPAKLLRKFPGNLLQDPVAKLSDLKPPQIVQANSRCFAREPTLARLPVRLGKYLRAQERRRKQFVPRRHLRSRLGKHQRYIWANHIPCHSRLPLSKLHKVTIIVAELRLSCLRSAA